MTISMLVLYGAIAGLIIGVIIPRPRLGCVALLIFPIAMIVYVSRWQAAHPKNSALDFIFIPLWPSLGALAGFVIALALRSWLASRNGNGG